LVLYIGFSFFLALFYAFLMLRYRKDWKALEEWNLPEKFVPSTKISVLIPARNEAANIEKCLSSVCNQNYPSHLFEVIVIDDHSTDDTPTIVQNFPFENIQLIRLADHINEADSRSFKKKALETALRFATGELIVSTDADCKVPSDWLAYFASIYQEKEVQFIAAPVNFHQEKSLLERFQSLDFIGMMGITGAGIHGRYMSMCNGANLAYTKSAFEAVNGFEGVDHLASGDDMLLMQKIAAKFPGEIAYIKNRSTTVHTTAKSTWSSFLRQRIRWASKSGSYQEKQVTFSLAMVFFFCCNIFLSLILIPFFGKIMCWIFLEQLFVKIVIDWIFLKEMSTYFKRKDLMKVFFPSQILHIFYIVVIGFLSNLKKEYIWKGRKVQ